MTLHQDPALTIWSEIWNEMLDKRGPVCVSCGVGSEPATTNGRETTMHISDGLPMIEPHPPYTDEDGVSFTWKLVLDLQPGDVFVREEWESPYVDVEVLGGSYIAEDRFGRPMIALPCKRLDTGAEGPVMFGQRGQVRVRA